MTANSIICYLGSLSKLVGKYNNNYHVSIGKKLINADWSDLTEEIETNPKDPKFRISDRSSIILISAKVTPIIGQSKHLLLILCWKLILERIELKIQTKKQ